VSFENSGIKDAVLKTVPRGKNFPEPALADVLCFLAIMGAAFAFLAASGVAGGMADHLDRQVELEFLPLINVPLTQLMLAFSWLGAAGCLYTGVVAGVILIYRWERTWLLTLVIAAGAHDRLTIVLKTLFHRDRPHPVHPLILMTDYSFPSGHVLAATLLYGWLAMYAAYHIRDQRQRAAAIVGCCSLIALVGMSRMYLQVHYLSDVLAGGITGAAWLAVSMTTAHQCRSLWAFVHRPFLPMPK
jgi:membrane-associated phospholipid phosphatase